MKEFLIGFAAALVASSAAAQAVTARDKEWGAMYNRMNSIIDPYQAKLGLPRYWNTYCLDKTNLEEDAHPKDGSVPLGVVNWNALPEDQFKVTLHILEEYRTAEMMLCLADVKARLKAAERP